jgi:RES domain-containing protein
VDRTLAVAVAGCGTTNVAGVFERHVSPRVLTLTGSNAGGRWGPTGAYSVLYLGRPTESVIVEAYRHLVEDSEGMTAAQVGPRRLLTVAVDLTNVLDLRIADHRAAVNLSESDLRTDPGHYARCQRIGQVAHQLGLHGIIAPAATGLGETLAVFELHLPADEQPTLVSQDVWSELPADPRTPRLVSEQLEDRF